MGQAEGEPTWEQPQDTQVHEYLTKEDNLAREDLPRSLVKPRCPECLAAVVLVASQKGEDEEGQSATEYTLRGHLDCQYSLSVLSAIWMRRSEQCLGSACVVSTKLVREQEEDFHQVFQLMD